MGIRSLGHSTSPYDAVMGTTGNGAEHIYPTFQSNGERGLFMGGGNGENYLDYITISSTGNATDFGNLQTDISAGGGVSNKVRGAIGGGYNPSSMAQNVIQYVTIASTGNAQDFGDLTVGRDRLAAVSNINRGCWGGGNGRNPGSFTSNTIDYVTIASTGNAQDFGDLTTARERMRGGSSNGVRGVFWGTKNNNVMDYITIPTTGNAVDFGDMNDNEENNAACGNLTRGLCFGGGQGSPSTARNEIRYITIATTGNSSDFGDMDAAYHKSGSCASDTRGINAGGLIGGGSGSNTNVILYVTINTTGNSTDFGDLVQTTEYPASTSGDA
tara:strand:- start:1814 stop:2797 length:984 start_codon:yes stop_codon:yes gene_type:complete